jgi:hypothetical protein
LLAVHWSSSEGQNPWSVFVGLRGTVYGVAVASRVYDINLRIVDPEVLEVSTAWGLEEDLNLLTGLGWKRRYLVPQPKFQSRAIICS